MLMVLIVWVCSAIVALVILRQGSKAASGVLALAMLPALVAAYIYGDVIPIGSVVCTSILAVLLRVTRSWSLVLTTAPFLIGIVAGALLLFGRDYLEQMLAVSIEMVKTMQEQWLTLSVDAKPESKAVVDLYFQQMLAVNVESLAGGYAFQLMLQAVLSLMTARFWQAKLYNPGGFKQEFHQLRLSRSNVLLLAGGLIVLTSTTLYKDWAWLFAIPLIVSSMALAHGLVGIKKLGRHWLVIFYLLLAIFLPAFLMIAIIDSAVDFRGRLARAKA